MLMTVVLNGGMFLGFLVMMELFYNSPDHHLFGYSYMVWTGYPMYLACLIVNGRFFQSISKETFRLQPSPSIQIDLLGTNQDMTLAVYTTLLYTIFAIFVFLLRLIPIVGKTISFVASCIIMSYYCFEYKWTYIGWSKDQSMLFIEKHWAYFLGFGLPVAALTFFLSTLHAGAVFALVYPSLIIIASSASPKPSMAVYGEPLVSDGPVYFESWTLPLHIPLFYPVRQMSHLTIYLIKTVGGKKADSILTHKKDIMGKLV
ncbi:etoposide-induced protein 2.4-domain-containing protein [Phycomyces blakesleeanus]|uniref:Etoposide-induced protein 2.4-domain-containing protein n=1 Tax=Phycomyces blakesleeanus TaxID=4837 RepID=A0ABR3BBK3_PHYBL